MPRSVVFYRNSALGRMSPLVSASRAGQLAEVRRLLGAVEADTRGEYGITSLHMAALHNHPPVVKADFR